MREASTRWVPISIVRHEPNLNPSLDTSSDVAPARIPPAVGPPRPAAPRGGARLDADAGPVDSRRIGLRPLGTLPAGRLEEDRPQLALTQVEWREADVAVGRPLLTRMDDAVRLVEAFGRSRAHVRA